MPKRNSFIFKKNKAKNEIKVKIQLFLMRLLTQLAWACQLCFYSVTEALGLTVGLIIRKAVLIEDKVAINLSKYFL